MTTPLNTIATDTNTDENMLLSATTQNTAQPIKYLTADDKMGEFSYYSTFQLTTATNIGDLLFTYDTTKGFNETKANQRPITWDTCLYNDLSASRTEMELDIEPIVVGEFETSVLVSYEYRTLHQLEGAFDTTYVGAQGRDSHEEFLKKGAHTRIITSSPYQTQMTYNEASNFDDNQNLSVHVPRCIIRIHARMPLQLTAMQPDTIDVIVKIRPILIQASDMIYTMNKTHRIFSKAYN